MAFLITFCALLGRGTIILLQEQRAANKVLFGAGEFEVQEDPVPFWQTEGDGAVPVIGPARYPSGRQRGTARYLLLDRLGTLLADGGGRRGTCYWTGWAPFWQTEGDGAVPVIGPAGHPSGRQRGKARYLLLDRLGTLLADGGGRPGTCYWTGWVPFWQPEGEGAVPVIGPARYPSGRRRGKARYLLLDRLGTLLADGGGRRGTSLNDNGLLASVPPPAEHEPGTHSQVPSTPWMG
ncbi:unnamed protein product [Boreogadus saida]